MAKLKYILPLLLIPVLAGTIHAASQQYSLFPNKDNKQKWVEVPEMTSAVMSGSGYALASSFGLSWWSGSKAIVTFWKMPDTTFPVFHTIRCIDYFDSNMRETSGRCDLPLAVAGKATLPANPADKP